MRNSTRKVVKATLYVAIGAIVIAAAMAFMTFLFFSAWLPGMYVVRKLLYAVTFVVILCAAWFVHEGYTYIKRRW